MALTDAGMCASRMIESPMRIGLGHSAATQHFRRSKPPTIAGFPRSRARSSRSKCYVFHSRRGGRDGPGPSEIDDLYDDGFEGDTRDMMLRVLTARAVQRVLLQLHHDNKHAAHWLNDYCSSSPPLSGNQFMVQLYSQPLHRVLDRHTGEWVTVAPADIASHILDVRDMLSRRLIQGFPDYVNDRNLEVLRDFLEANTYTAGEHWAEGPANVKRTNKTRRR